MSIIEYLILDVLIAMIYCYTWTGACQITEERLKREFHRIIIGLFNKISSIMSSILITLIDRVAAVAWFPANNYY